VTGGTSPIGLFPFISSTGNVRDLVPLRQNGNTDFLSLEEFLSHGLFGQRDLVLHYDRGGLSFVPFVELVLGLYFTAMAVYAAAYGIYGTLPFILIFQAGFLYTACLSLFQDVARFMVPREQEA